VLFLAPTDLSKRSEKALTRAAVLAWQHQAELLVLHVVDYDQPEERQQADIATAEREISRQLRHPLLTDKRRLRHEVRIGMDFQTILDTAQETGAEMIIMGEQRRGFFKGVFTGTTVERVIRGSTLPSLIVREFATRPYRSAAACLDLGHGSAEVLTRAVFAAPDADLSVLHAVNDVERPQLLAAGLPADLLAEHDDNERRAARERIGDVVASAGRVPAETDILIAEGAPVPTLAGLLERVGAELAVVGTRTHTMVPAKRWLLGSVAESIIQESPCDVLVVPIPEQDSTGQV